MQPAILRRELAYGVEIVRQLVPILRGRLNFASCTLWLRDENTGTLRVAASDGVVTATRVLRPSPLAMRAFISVEPCSEGSQLAVPMVIKRRMVGVIDVATEAVETPEEVAATIAEAARHVPPDRILACTNCGMAPMRREVALAKLDALSRGAALARERLRPGT